MFRKIRNCFLAFFMFLLPVAGFGFTLQPIDFVIINPVIKIPGYKVIIPDLYPVIR